MLCIEQRSGASGKMDVCGEMRWLMWPEGRTMPAMEMLLMAVAAFIVMFAGTLLNGWLSTWVIESFTRARDPAFAAYCWTFGAMSAGVRWIEDMPSGWLLVPGLLGIAGIAAGLLLLWKKKVVPERAAASAQE